MVCNGTLMYGISSFQFKNTRSAVKYRYRMCLLTKIISKENDGLNEITKKREREREIFNVQMIQY